jgi:uncharacterized protein YuzE
MSSSSSSSSSEDPIKTTKPNLGLALFSNPATWTDELAVVDSDTIKVDAGTILLIDQNAEVAGIDFTGEGTVVVMNANVTLTITDGLVLKGSYGIYEFNRAGQIVGKGVAGL